MITYVFPGQGSQEKGMGEKLFEEFSELEKRADRILGYSIRELCVEDPKNQLNLTQYTQPALFVVNALMYYHKWRETKRKPDYVAGHSLGEYNALLAAEVFDFETGLELVKKRGELMAQASGGGMAAVLLLKEEEVREVLEKYHLNSLDIANLNSEKQTVLSGPLSEIENAKKLFEQEGARYMKLKVSAAFHSRYMKEAQVKFARYMEKFSFLEPKIPVISNVTAKPYENSQLQFYLTEQLCASVRWRESVQYLLGLGEMEFEEIGPGKVLTKLVAKIKQEVLTMQKAEYGFPVSAAEQKRKEDGRKGNVYSERMKIAQKKAADFNQICPVGSKVICKGQEEVLTTRTKAQVLFGHRAAVYVEGYEGYFDVEEIQILPQ